MRQKIAAGNWKMNGTRADLAQLQTLAQTPDSGDVCIVICPPAPLLFPACEVAKDSNLHIGGQDCHAAVSGAHTGDISAPMIKDAGGEYVIVGHSERREAYHESDQDVRSKAMAANAAGLKAIICIGESLEDREANNTLTIIGTQLAGSLPDDASAQTLIIAYEPIWAIGTGKVPTLEQIIEVHDFIRSELTTRFGAGIADGISLLYGGSVKASNAAEIFTAANVDGALVGGASLKAADFTPIITALAQS